MQTSREISVGSLRVGGNQPLFLIAGPCVIESEAHCSLMAERLAGIAAELKIPLIFKASYDKANRSSLSSYRGPGLVEGLRVMRRIKERFGLPILTDVHDPSHVPAAAEVCDVLQIPAFLSRQTDLLVAAGKSNRVVNLKKGQFLSPWEMANAVEKVESTGNHRVIVTERGIAVNSQRRDLLQAMAKCSLPIKSIAEIQQEVYGICGGAPAKPHVKKNRPVAVVEWVDGTLLDTTISVFPFITFLRFLSTKLSVLKSREEKTSSSIRTFGLRRMALASATLCLCPPERLSPLSPTIASKPPGNSIISS